MRPVRLLWIGRNSGPSSSSPWPAASRYSWMRPSTPPTEPSAGVERWIGSIKLYRALARAAVVMLVTISWRLWAARRSPALYAGMLQCAHTEADGSAPCKGEHIHDDRCSD